MKRIEIQKICRILFILILVVPIIYICIANLFKPYKAAEIKSINNILPGDIQFTRLYIEELYINNNRDEIREEILDLVQNNEIQKFLDSISEYKFSNDYKVLDELTNKSGSYGVERYLISCNGETSDARMSIYFKLIPETKVTYLNYTEIEKGTDEMKIKAYYSLEEELYNDIMQNYIILE